MAEDSILITIKKMLGLDSDYTPFDTEVMVHINSVFSLLAQLGAAPSEGFYIDGAEEKWSDYFPDPSAAQLIKTYIYLKVRLLFDPPATSFVIASMEKQIQEYEWRINVMADRAVTADGEQFPQSLWG